MNNTVLENCKPTHTFVETVGNVPVTFYIIKMENCLFVWIGEKCIFENLAVAMNTQYNPMPISTSVMGNFEDDNSCLLATKLAKKTGKQVFASFNVSKADNNVLLLINRRLMQELNDHPENF